MAVFSSVFLPLETSREEVSLLRSVLRWGGRLKTHQEI